MNILIVRHAIAEDRFAFSATGAGDEHRPLTPKGINRMEQAARGLKQIQPELQYIAHSPLTRAVQTADILARQYPTATRLEYQELAPGYPPRLLAKQLGKLPEESTIALVGHEPDLSELIGWLTTGEQESFVQLKKGAACLLQSWRTPTEASAQLLWCLTPRQLRQLGNL